MGLNFHLPIKGLYGLVWGQAGMEVNGGGDVCMDAGGVWEISVLP